MASLWSRLPTPDRVLAVNELDDSRPIAGIDQWIAAGGANDPAAHAIKGAHAVAWAWAARGTGRAETVTPDGWVLYFDRLRAADRDLHAAIRLTPGDVYPWIPMINGGKGLQIPKAELRLRFENQFRRDASSLAGHKGYLQAIAGKWSGSDQQMWDFAIDAHRSVAAGSPLHCLVADAFVERFLLSGEAGFAAEGIAAVVAAAKASIFHPAFSQANPLEQEECLSSFAQAFYFTSHKELGPWVNQMLDVRSSLPGCFYLAEEPIDRWRALDSRKY